ncbi:hypothetical protein M426DRAFT_71651 [Hypoxylon sp. CI-4A]|nr:hypothetical protein M426DRAFT_71651 [Hypoxylon sp. CI-4A]
MTPEETSDHGHGGPKSPPPIGPMARLRAFWKSVKPWHIYAVLATVVVIVVVVVPTAVLVTRRNHEKALEEHRKAVEQAKSTPSNPSIARVNLGYAQYQGSHVGTGVCQYLGMRYAAPPTGERRWRAPVEPEMDDSGDQAADTFGPICLGISYTAFDGTQDEDCLYANVWAPANATMDSKLPVWLFIQGGGYTQNSNANWNGTALLERSNRNIIFVNFNYRVGLWGFLASERVRANGSGDLNVGLRDQRAMMRWVRRYIAQFGGDSEHVVIVGASAGAGSVALQLVISAFDAAEDGKKLFVGGIGESVFFPAQPRLEELEWQFDGVLAQTGCDGVADPMACLRALDTATLQSAANIPSPFPGRPGLPEPLPLFYFTPCVDGDLLPDLPFDFFASGSFVDVPMIMGSTTDEGTVFSSNASSESDMETFFQNNYPLLSSTQASAIVDEYPLSIATPLAQHAAWFPSSAKAYGEATFVCPGAYVLSSYTNHTSNSNTTASNKSSAWGYRYDVYDATNAALGLGVEHIWESWAVYGPDSQAGPGNGPASYYTTAAGVVGPVMDYWISFVRTLNPNTLKSPDAPTWESWVADDGGRRRLLFQADKFSMEDVPEDQQRRCEFWRDLASTTEQKV